MTDYSKIWKIMQKYKFKFDLELSTDLKCTVCNDVVIDARRGSCGCLYCQGCLKMSMRDGVKGCHAKNGICKHRGLGTVNYDEIHTTIDDNANNRVSTLKCECPFDHCDYSCELVAMADHLRMCDKREVVCPYSEIGCRATAIPNHGLSNHLAVGVHEHSIMMNEWIINIKNEISSLTLARTSTEQSQQDQLRIVHTKLDQMLIDNAAEGCKQQALVDELRKEVVHVKNKNKEFEKFMKKCQAEMKIKNKEMDELRECCKEVSFLKESVKSVSRANELLQNRMERLHKTFMIDDNEESSEELVDSHGASNEGVPELRDRVPASPMVYLEWEIADVYKLRRNRTRIWSEEFYSTKGVYKMRLLFDSFGSHDGSQMSIRLFIYDGICARARWPFAGIATVAVENKDARHCSKSLSRHLQIDKPADALNDPHFFYFSFSELNHAGVFGSGSIIIDWRVTITDQ